LEKKNRSKTLVITSFLLVAGFAQTTLVRLVPEWASEWLGHVDWLMLVTVYIRASADPIRALLTGVAAGVIHDLLSGANLTGVAGMSYILAAYVAHSVSTLFIVDSLIFRFVAVILSTITSTTVRLVFALMKITFPVLAGSDRVAAYYVLSIFVHLIASTLLFIPFDRLFQKRDALRQRRMEARRRKR
jgi:rod shape-determining protein MreD